MFISIKRPNTVADFFCGKQVFFIIDNYRINVDFFFIHKSFFSRVMPRVIKNIYSK